MVRLTLAEARQLRLCAENGYGDGDFYDLRPNGPEERAYLRATNKLSNEITKAQKATAR